MRVVLLLSCGVGLFNVLLLLGLWSSFAMAKAMQMSTDENVSLEYIMPIGFCLLIVALLWLLNFFALLSATCLQSGRQRLPLLMTGWGLQVLTVPVLFIVLRFS
jgi:hypothetical protein